MKLDDFDKKFKVQKGADGEYFPCEYGESCLIAPEAVKSYIRELLESLRKQDDKEFYPDERASMAHGYNIRNDEINSQIDTILKNL